MTQYLPYIFSLLALISFKAKAQEAEVDTIKLEVNQGLQLYVDYGKLLTQLSDFESKLEFGIAYQFRNRFQPNFQYGMASVDPVDAIENGEYNAEGSYWRAGINYILPLDNINSLYLGVKYAQLKFEDSGSYMIESEFWPTLEGGFQRTDMEADWFEAILGSEKKLKGGHLILGGQTGVRFINTRPTGEFIDIYSIPGYGLWTDSSTPFLNLYIKYQF